MNFSTVIKCLTFTILASQSGIVLDAQSIIPQPTRLEKSDGKFKSASLIFQFIPEFNNNYLVSLVDQINGYYPAIISNNSDQSNISLIHDEDLPNEGYRLIIAPKTITFGYKDEAGLQYALTTLLQIARHAEKSGIPCLTIEDIPGFAYRGMHLDVARHFFSLEEVKSYLDYMAYYKFNRFHWHLTEDQGWRIEIKRYPKLQEIAAYRDETLIGHYSEKPHRFDGVKYGGYYTQEEVREIVHYATERNIQVIPEIEMPGHSQAALAAYPELGCGPGPYKVATLWGVFEDVYCPKESTFEFLEGVLDEVIELFPYEYIHIGGDECPKAAWKACDHCQNLIKELGLKDEHELQSYFITRMEKYLNSKGKSIIGWDEILEGGLAPNATVMSWRGIQGGIEAARAGHKVIMTPTDYCYFDYYQSREPAEPTAIGGFLPLSKVYNWQVVPAELTVDESSLIWGGQANVWTEYMKTFSQVEYMAYMRMMAMSEVLWGTNHDYENFTERIDTHKQHWISKGKNLAGYK